MPADPNVDAILAAIEKLRSDDVIEDTAYEATIANLEVQVAALVAERDSLKIQITGVIADTEAAILAIETEIAALKVRLTNLGV